nr:lysophospholipase [Spirosomataceae bacterium]
MNKIIKYFLILAAAYLVFALVAWIFQRQIFLHPRKLAKDFQYKFDIPHQEGFYIHGNAHNLSRWGKHAHEFTNRGYEVLMYDFREFGKSNGRLTEANLISDAQYIYDSLKTKYPENKIILYGRSLGTGVAVRLASTNSPKQLILETPYYSLPEVGWSHAPILPYNLL